MNLTNQQIQDFQNLYWKHFKVKISKETARRRGLDLVRLTKTIYSNNNLTFEKHEKQSS